MAARYQHIIAAIRRDAATSVGGLLWKPAGSADDDNATVPHTDRVTGKCHHKCGDRRSSW